MAADKIISVSEAYQTGYQYPLTAPTGKEFADDFKPGLTPKEMLQLGVFGSDYFPEVPSEFPADWFDGVELSGGAGRLASRNYFKVNASQPLKEWQRKDWIYEEDPHGWFLWYCRYYSGRRIPAEDARQIKRWRNMRRHVSQLQSHCMTGDVQCQPRRRQALLHWAYDSRKL